MADTPAMKAARKTPGEHAGPDNSFPITSQKNVNSAIHLLDTGHGKGDRSQIRANVDRIAHEKGFSVPKAPEYHKPRRWVP